MDGEGTYFTQGGESLDGIFHKSALMVEGIPIPPYLDEKNRTELVTKITEGRTEVPQNIELPVPLFINSSDMLVESISDAMKMRRVNLIVRSTRFKGDIETILEVLDKKKAQFLFYSLSEITDQNSKQEFLFGLKEAMECGSLLVIDIDYRSYTMGEFFVNLDLANFLPPKILNRDSQAIIREFRVVGMDPPELMHPDFLIVLLGAARFDSIREDCSEKIGQKYKWVHQVSRISISVLEEFKRYSPLYQTELVEESVNFENVERGETGVQ